MTGGRGHVPSHQQGKTCPKATTAISYRLLIHSQALLDEKKVKTTTRQPTDRNKIRSGETTWQSQTGIAEGHTRGQNMGTCRCHVWVKWHVESEDRCSTRALQLKGGADRNYVAASGAVKGSAKHVAPGRKTCAHVTTSVVHVGGACTSCRHGSEVASAKIAKIGQLRPWS